MKEKDNQYKLNKAIAFAYGLILLGKGFALYIISQLLQPVSSPNKKAKNCVFYIVVCHLWRGSIGYGGVRTCRGLKSGLPTLQ